MNNSDTHDVEVLMYAGLLAFTTSQHTEGHRELRDHMREATLAILDKLGAETIYRVGDEGEAPTYYATQSGARMASAYGPGRYRAVVPMLAVPALHAAIGRK